MLPIVLSRDTAYATKGNILFPGTQAQATAAEGLADTRIEDSTSGVGLTVSIAAGSVKPES